MNFLQRESPSELLIYIFELVNTEISQGNLVDSENTINWVFDNLGKYPNFGGVI